MSTIVLLSAKRSGSTAVFRMFQRHPGVGVPHPDQSIDLWEPNFWNYAARAIAGDPAPFTERFAHDPVIDRTPRTEREAFALWDAMLAARGPVLFDKSPKLLAQPEGIDLLLRYRDTGRNIHPLALVRDPRDAIASQYMRWSHVVESDSPQRRECAWVESHRRLLELRSRIAIPIFRYEDLAASPAVYASSMLACAGLPDLPACYDHIRPVSIGRHRTARHPELRAWRPGEDLLNLLEHFGYQPARTPATIAP